MCISTTVAPRSAQSAAISPSPRSAVTSLTMAAPASRAASATVALEVSTEISVPPPANPVMTGTTRRNSSASETSSAPGRVDSPPTSKIAAPARASSSPWPTAASGSEYRPPPENGSGVTSTTPINRGRVITEVSRPSLPRVARGEMPRPKTSPPASPPVTGPVGRGGRRYLACVPARKTRAWVGVRPCPLALRPLRLRRRLGRLGRLLVLSEDLVLGLAFEQGGELVGVDRLPLQQQFRDPVEFVAALAEQALGGLVGALDDAADLAGDLVGVVRLGGELAAEEGLTAVVAEDAGAESLGHAEPHHHLLCRLGHLFEVVGGAGGDLAEDDLLGGAAAQGHRHRVGQLGAGGEELVLGRQADRVAERLAAADDRDLVDRVAVGQEVADDRVPHLVIGGDQALLLAHHPGLLLGAGDHPHDPLLELLHAALATAGAGGQQGGLVDQVGEVGTGESGGLRGEGVELDLPAQRLAAGVDLEDVLAALAVGTVDDDLAIETPGAQQGRVEDVGPVGGRDQDDVVLHLEAVHLDQELVQRLLALVVTAAHAGAPVAADGVDLVHEDDAGRVLFGLLEEVADAAGADADEHLDEVRAGDREEGDAGLAGDGAGQQRLTGAGRAVQQDALGNPGPQGLELLRVLEEFLDLLQLLHGLVDPGDVAEGDFRRVDGHPLRFRFAEVHHPRAAALHLVHEEDPEAEEEDEGQDEGEQREQAAAAGAMHHRLRLHVFVEQVDQALLGVGRVARGEAFAVLLLDVERVVLGVDRDFFDLIGRDQPVLGLNQFVVGRRRGTGVAGDHFLGDEGQDDHQKDRERRAFKETPQG